MSNVTEEPKGVGERVAFLESKLRELETRLARLEGPHSESPTRGIDSARTENERPKISVALISKTFHNANYSEGDAGDRIDFALYFKNHLGKDVRAFKGAVNFKDLFDQLILSVTLTDESGVKAGGTITWKGGIQFNQFFDTHQRLLTIESKDTAVSFDLHSVVYKDGTRESFG